MKRFSPYADMPPRTVTFAATSAAPLIPPLATFFLMATLTLAGCATQMEKPIESKMENKSAPSAASTTASAATPANLTPSATEQQVLRLPAVGVQIYECKAVDGKPPAWVFVAPEADLFDESGLRVGKHYAGPTWELNDGSKIVGAVKERANATVPGAIPWLLLSAKSSGGAGKLEKVTSLQRVNTIGGVAPTSGCTANDIGKQARVYYKADYVYFAPK
jgi:Protein of unknown function (DUF3455)